MPRLVFALLCLLLLATVQVGCQAARPTTSREPAAARQVIAAASPLSGSQQLVLVVADDWDANQARLRRFERRDQGAWRPVGDDVAVTLGKNGLAWGRGLHGAALGEGPVKMEGDGRSPAGVFTFSTAFAYQPDTLWGKPKLPVHRVTDQTVCVESIGSASYNRIVDEDTVAAKDWESPDRMLRPDGLYRYGLFVDHNAPNTTPGAGSCIFFHLWRRPGAPTAGCTAMNEPAIQVILAWMDAAKRPVLVQLPRAQLARLASAWGAPELAARPKTDD